SESLPSNTIADPKGDLKAIITRSELGLPELISTRMTLELANRAICTPAGIAKDVFVPIGKFTFLADFIIVDYKSDPRVPLILERPFLRTARALIDVHGEEMILRDEGGNVLPEKLLYLDSTKDLHPPHHVNLLSGSITSSVQTNCLRSSPMSSLLSHFHREMGEKIKESKLLIDELDLPSDSLPFFEYDLILSEDFSEVDALPLTNNEDKTARALIDVYGEKMILRDEGGNVLIEKLLDPDSTKDLHPPHHVNPLSGSTTSSSFPNQLLEEFADELALITFPPGNDDLSKLADLNDNLVDTMPEMFIDEHALDYSSHSIFDEYDDDLFEVEFDTENVYDDPFNSKGKKIKDSKLLMDELDIPCDFLPSFEYDLFPSEDFSRVDALPSINNEDKCKALADLYASINLMPLSVSKKVGLPENISTRMTLELANRAIYAPAGIARDVFIPVSKFTFPANFVIEYET
nr:reverse transcriptase domain-containing protein [Tanacetum cinerariifolium]